MSNKSHYFLIVAAISFSLPKEDDVATISLNAIINGSTRELPVRAIGKAQQVAQLQFYERMLNPEITVHDVVISNIIYLGEMTKEQFEAPPEGMIQQEKTDHV